MGNSCLKVLGFECAGNREKHITEIEKDRVCTDVPCMLLFIAVWVAVFGMLAFSIENGGDPNKLIHGVDFNGDICGISSAVENQPLAAWPDRETFDFQVCVDDCAKTEDETVIGDMPYESLEFLGHCVPTSLTEVPDQLSSGTETFNRYIGDLNTAKYMILGAAGIALVFAFFYAWLSKKVVGILVWGSILVTVAFGIVISYSLLQQARDLDDDVVDQSDEKKLLNIFGGISVVLTFIFIVLVIALRKRIEIAIEVVREASKAVFDMPSMMFYPIIPFLWTVGLFSFWIIVASYIWTAGPLEDGIPTPDGVGDIFPETFSSFQHDENFKNAAVFHVFFLFWAFAFTVYTTYIVICGAVAVWYFTYPENDVRRVEGSPLWDSFKRNTFYHLGTVAFGSLLIAIVQLIRAAIRYVEEKTRGQSNQVTKAIICMCKCFFWCLEKCLDKLSKNGLIFTAIYGDAFCAASWNAFALLIRNLARVAAINLVGEYVIVLGKIMISVVTTGICGLVFLKTDYFVENLSSSVLPLIIIFVMSYLIGSVFMVIYETTIDTIFLCFLVDEEANGDGRMFASSSLLEVIGKYEKESKEIAAQNKDAVGLSEPLLKDDETLQQKAT